MYCIIDVETTGGTANKEKLTEIAIVKHDGERIVDTYTTLINPERSIPPFITRLTGITQDMVSDAPRFFEVAKDIVKFTESCVFVAHNAQFDYSFVKKEFAELGYTYSRKTLCTLRLAKKLVPGLQKYGLGALTEHFHIPLKQHHRALEDAMATAKLFAILWELNNQQKDLDLIKQDLRTTLLPKNLDPAIYHDLPTACGVYYIKNKRGDIIYIGKANNIKARLNQHFQTNYKDRKGEEFKDNIYDIDYKLTGNELVALLLESDEIKSHRPFWNVAQKRVRASTGLYYSYSETGIIEFQLRRIDGNRGLLTQFGTKRTGLEALHAWAEKLELCKNYCHLMDSMYLCLDHEAASCRGTCKGKESTEEYNQRARKLIDYYEFQEPNFFVVGKGRDEEEKSVVWVHQGTYQGFGFVPADVQISNFEQIEAYISPRKENRDIRRILKGYLRKHPKALKSYQEIRF